MNYIEKVMKEFDEKFGETLSIVESDMIKHFIQQALEAQKQLEEVLIIK